MGIPKWCLVTLCQCQLDQIATVDADGAREDQVRVIMMTMKKMMMMVDGDDDDDGYDRFGWWHVSQPWRALPGLRAGHATALNSPAPWEHWQISSMQKNKLTSSVDAIAITKNLKLSTTH